MEDFGVGMSWINLPPHIEVPVLVSPYEANLSTEGASTKAQARVPVANAHAGGSSHYQAPP